MFSLSLSSHPQDLAASRMRLLYLTGGAADADAATAKQLGKVDGNVDVVSVDSIEQALAELRKDGARFRALLMSPGLTEKETIALILTLRKEHAPVGIVPVVTESHRGLCSSAVAAGADAVLLMLNGQLVDPRETLSRLKPRHATESAGDKKAPAAVVATQRALAELRKLHSLLHTSKPEKSDSDDPASNLPPVEAARLRLEARLNDAHAAAARMTQEDQNEVKPPPAPLPTVHTAPTPQSSPKTGASKAGPAWRRSSALTPQKPRRWNDQQIEGATRAAFEGALNAARTELRQAVESHAAEKRAWEAQKARLETDLLANQADPTLREAVEAMLNDTRKELADKSDALSREHQALESTREELHAQVQRLETEKEQLGTTLGIERGEQQRLSAEHLSDRHTWRETETELNRRVESLRSALDALEADLQASRAAARDAAAEYASERDAWHASRQDLETDLTERMRELEAAGTMREELEGSLKVLQAELHQVSSMQASSSAAWEKARQTLTADLEARQNELHAAKKSIEELEKGRAQAASVAADLHRAKARAEANVAELEKGKTQAEQAKAQSDQERIASDRAKAQAEKARTEAEQARAAAEQAKAQAEQLRAQAERARDQAEQARSASDEARAQAEAARKQAEHGQAQSEAARAAAEHARSQADKVRGDVEKAKADVDARLKELTATSEVIKFELEGRKSAYAAAQSSWTADRQKLDAELASRASALEAAGQARVQLEQALVATQSELKRVQTVESSRAAAAEQLRQRLGMELEARSKELKAAQAASEVLEKNKAHAEQLRGEAEKARENAEQIAARAERARTDAEREKAEAQKVAAAADQRRVEAEQIRAQAEKARAEAEKAKAEAEKAKAEAEKAKAEAEKSAARAEQARAEAEQRGAQIDKARALAEKSHKETEAAMAAVERSLAETDKARQLAEGRSAELAKQVKELHTAAESARTAAESAGAAALKAHQDVEARNARLEMQVKDLKAAAEGSRAAADKARQEAEARIAQLDGQIKELQAGVTSTRLALDARTAEHATAAKEWTTLRERLEGELAARNRDVQASIEARDHDVNAAMAARAEMEGALHSAKAELQKAAASQASMASAWDAARHQLEEQLQKRTEDLQASGRAKVDLQMTLDGVRAESRLAHDLHTSDAEALAAMREELDQSVRASAAADQERQRLQASLRDVGLERTHLSAANGVLERQLAEARDRIRQLSEEAETMRTRFDSAPDSTDRAAPVQPVAVQPAAPAANEPPRQVSGTDVLGKMGAAMAPEIESLISQVDRAAHELVRELGASNPGGAKARSIAEQSERAASLLRQLVSVSRRQARPAATIDLNDVVTRVEPTLGSLAGDDIELTIALGQTASLAIGENDLEQILTALVFSARESLTMGGSILLSTSGYDPGQNAGGAQRVMISTTAFGYGVQAAQSSSALETVVKRCGGELSLGGEPDRDAILQVFLPQAAV